MFTAHKVTQTFFMAYEFNKVYYTAHKYHFSIILPIVSLSVRSSISFGMLQYLKAI